MIPTFLVLHRELLHTEDRKIEIFDKLKSVLGEETECGIDEAETEIRTNVPQSSFPEETFNFELREDSLIESSCSCDFPSITIDNTLSAGHTLIQINCRDYKGLLYDVMRTLKEYNIQVLIYSIL